MKPQQFILIGTIAGLVVGAGLSYSVFIARENQEINQQYDRSDMFFLAVGLYSNETHPCPKHADSCDAEYKNVPVDYAIVSGDGEFILRDSALTGENGFFDLYLPKGKEYIATFTVDRKEGVGIIPTKHGSSNCITEIKVQ
jgi:hypothetical protein